MKKITDTTVTLQTFALVLAIFMVGYTLGKWLATGELPEESMLIFLCVLPALFDRKKEKEQTHEI